MLQLQPQPQSQPQLPSDQLLTHGDLVLRGPHEEGVLVGPGKHRCSPIPLCAQEGKEI